MKVRYIIIGALLIACILFAGFIVFFSLYAPTVQLDAITLPVDSPMNNADAYVVIMQPYVSLKDNPGKNGISVGYVRKKEVYQVKGKEFVPKDTGTELWVHIANGWLARSCVEFYSSKSKAVTASKEML